MEHLVIYVLISDTIISCETSSYVIFLVAIRWLPLAFLTFSFTVERQSSDRSISQLQQGVAANEPVGNG